jgi:hypothetical protein
MIRIYILVLGAILAAIGAFELYAPMRAFSFWKSWIFKKFFFLHGLLIISAGFPLTIYNGPLSKIIFIVGLIAVFTGPFILLYPEKIRSMFDELTKKMEDEDIRKMMYVEGSLRIAAGIICALTFILG